MSTQTRRIVVLALIYLGSAVGLTFLVLRKEKKEIHPVESVPSTDVQSHSFHGDEILMYRGEDV